LENREPGDLKGEKRERTALDVVTGYWWVSWIGIIGAFLGVGGRECWQEFSKGGAAAPFSEILFLAVILSWIAFFAADRRERDRKRVVHLLTVMGTLLAVFTLLAIFFFARIAPRVQ